MGWRSFGTLVLLAVLLACLYRFPDLALRPMHTDEAILGMKFLEFWRTGVFDYDPHDYHGPFLHYLTRAVGWVLRWSGPDSVTETGLRTVPALCGLALILVTLCLTDALGRRATALSMLFLAVSPIMVFFSRYYIMEVPFVLLLGLFIASCWRFAQSRKRLWLLVAGAALGCLHATKETFVINLAAMACGWVAARVFTDGFVQRSSGLRLGMGRKPAGPALPWLWIVVTAVIVSVALFSGGFHRWEDVRESVTTYESYWKRSHGAGGHEKPWTYYFSILFWYKDFWVWTEAMTGGLAVVGILGSFFGSFGRESQRKAFHVFLSVYALAALAAYSIIPYKTPWTILSVSWAIALLAGAGVQVLFTAFRGKGLRWLVIGGLVVGVYQMCSQTMNTINDRGQANMRAPFVYSHTSTSAVKLAARLRELAAFAPKEFSAQVVDMDSGWPLPWYLRHIPSVGYQMTLPDTLPAATSVLVLDTTVNQEVAKARLPGKTFEPDHFSLRPGVNVTLLVEKGLWDRYLAAKTGAK